MHPVILSHLFEALFPWAKSVRKSIRGCPFSGNKFLRWLLRPPSMCAIYNHGRCQMRLVKRLAGVFASVLLCGSAATVARACAMSAAGVIASHEPFASEHACCSSRVRGSGIAARLRRRRTRSGAAPDHARRTASASAPASTRALPRSRTRRPRRRYPCLPRSAPRARGCAAGGAWPDRAP